MRDIAKRARHRPEPWPEPWPKPWPERLLAGNPWYNMGHGGRISWSRLILGGLLALAIAAALLLLIGPLAAARLAGGSNMQIKSDSMAPSRNS